MIKVGYTRYVLFFIKKINIQTKVVKIRGGLSINY